MAVIQGIVYLLVYAAGAWTMYRISESYNRRIREAWLHSARARRTPPQPHSDQQEQIFTEDDYDAICAGKRVYKAVKR